MTAVEAAVGEVWMVAAESWPLAKTGGLADVMGALPGAVAALGFRVRRFLPAYRHIALDGFAAAAPAWRVPLGPEKLPVRFLQRTEKDGVITTLVECDELFGRDGIYGTPTAEFSDNARRFVFLSRAVHELAIRGPEAPALVHAHDWHAASLPLLHRFLPGQRQAIPTVLTIHNLAYQGQYDMEAAALLSLPEELSRQLLQPSGLEFYGGISFLKAGIVYADAVTTVSPTYAEEILTPEYGCGLEGVLREQQQRLSGILNGIDDVTWDPACDPHLPRRYDVDTLEVKPASTARLRERAGLPPAGRPVAGVVSRLAYQKGIDVLVEAAPALLNAGADLVVLGAGDADLVQALLDLRRRFPERVATIIGHDEAAAHLVVAGSDIMLIPSRYEPCGLTQMHALRYGTLPVATRTGGLADTIVDAGENGARGNGFLLPRLSAEALAATVGRALELKRLHPAAWSQLQRRGMTIDFSWKASASRYAGLYQALLRRRESA